MNKKISTSLGLSLLIATNIYANDTAQLDEITVTSATKSAQSIKDVTSNIDVITKEEIEEKHFTTITEALNSLPGISFTSNGGMGKTTSVRLRGFDTQRVLVLIDGIRYVDFTSSNGSPFENIMLNDIKRIEVIKGAQSGIWGADASAGVINIITNDVNEGLNGNVNLEYGSYNTKKYGLNLSYATKKYYLKGFYNKIETDGYTAYAARRTDIDSYEDDGYENETYGLKTGFNIDDNNKIDLSYSITKSENEFDNFGSDSLTNESTGENKFASVSYENTNSFAKTNVYYNRSDFYRNYPPYLSEYDGKIDEIGIKTNIDYLDDTSFLVAGLDYKKFKQNDAVVNDYTNKGIYLTNSNRFNKTVFTQSIRFDDYDSFNNKTTGKLGVKHNFTDSLFLSSNIGTAYNIPKLNELYGAFGANPNLTPETTKSFDISLKYNDLKLTYFHNTIDDMIDWNGGAYNNLEGTSTIRGFEVEYKKEIFPDLLATLNYTKNYTKDNEDFKLERVPTDTFKSSFDYYGFDKLHIGISTEYVGDRIQYAYGTHTVNANTGNYTVWNSVVNYEINKTFSTYLKVDNLFNKYYQTVDGYATAERSAYIGLKATF